MISKGRGGEQKGSKGRGQTATLPLCPPPPLNETLVNMTKYCFFWVVLFVSLFSIPYIFSCTHTHNTHALFIYFYTAEILDEIRKNKFEKPTPIQVFNLYDWTGLCNHLCVNLKKYICC